VVCGRRSGGPVGWLENAVLPVGCDPKSVSEKVEPVAELVGVEAVVVPGVSDDVVSCGIGGPPELPARNEDATLVNVVAGAPVC